MPAKGGERQKKMFKVSSTGATKACCWQLCFSFLALPSQISYHSYTPFGPHLFFFFLLIPLLSLNSPSPSLCLSKQNKVCNQIRFFFHMIITMLPAYSYMSFFLYKKKITVFPLLLCFQCTQWIFDHCFIQKNLLAKVNDSALKFHF